MRERRLDPLTGEWTTFANVPPDRRAGEDEPCPLCPVARDGRMVVVEDLFPPLEASPPPAWTPSRELHAVAEARGAAEVVVYGGHHEPLGRLGPERLEGVIHVWADRYAQLGGRGEAAYVLVSEACGDAAGATSPHPHGRVDAFPEIPPRPRRELEVAAAHHAAHGACIVCDLVADEPAAAERTVASNASFLAYVPFAARLPYEVHVTARRHAASLLDLTDRERAALAEVLQAVLAAYDRLFGFPLPYVLAVHQAPTDDGQWQHVSHLHVELLSPQRSAGELKRPFAAEVAGGVHVNDAVPERSAERLRALVPA